MNNTVELCYEMNGLQVLRNRIRRYCSNGGIKQQEITLRRWRIGAAIATTGLMIGSVVMTSRAHIDKYGNPDTVEKARAMANEVAIESILIIPAAIIYGVCLGIATLIETSIMIFLFPISWPLYIYGKINQTSSQEQSQEQSQV